MEINNYYRHFFGTEKTTSNEYRFFGKSYVDRKPPEFLVLSVGKRSIFGVLLYIGGYELTRIDTVFEVTYPWLYFFSMASTLLISIYCFYQDYRAYRLM